MHTAGVCVRRRMTQVNGTEEFIWTSTTYNAGSTYYIPRWFYGVWGRAFNISASRTRSSRCSLYASTKRATHRSGTSRTCRRCSGTRSPGYPIRYALRNSKPSRRSSGGIRKQTPPFFSHENRAGSDCRCYCTYFVVAGGYVSELMCTGWRHKGCNIV